MNYAKAFWENNEKYHDLVETFDRGIKYYSPEYATGGRMCTWCSRYCSWGATEIVYSEYRGERI